jgi:hypothetical protein
LAIIHPIPITYVKRVANPDNVGARPVPPPVIATTNPFTLNSVDASSKDMFYQEGTGTKNFVSFGERQRLERYFIGTKAEQFGRI